MLPTPTLLLTRRSISHTFLIDGDEKHATELVALLRRSKQPVPLELARLAHTDKYVSRQLEVLEEAEAHGQMKEEAGRVDFIGGELH